MSELSEREERPEETATKGHISQTLLPRCRRLVSEWRLRRRRLGGQRVLHGWQERRRRRRRRGRLRLTQTGNTGQRRGPLLLAPLLFGGLALGRGQRAHGPERPQTLRVFQHVRRALVELAAQLGPALLVPDGLPPLDFWGAGQQLGSNVGSTPSSKSSSSASHHLAGIAG